MRKGTRDTTTLLVTSGKGGVGTSMIAALAALTAAARGKRVLLVDACESGGSLHHLFGVRPTHSLWMLSHPRVQPSDALVSVDEMLMFLPGGTSGAAVAPTSDDDRRASLSRLAMVYGDFDLVLFDGGSRLDTITAISDLTDPSLLLVTSADRLSLAANYALVKSVRARRSNAVISVVANRHGEALSAEACEYLVDACAHFLGRSIEIAGAVPDDPCLQASVGAGMSVRDAANGSPAADAIRAMLTVVLPSWSDAARSAPIPISSSFPSSTSPSPSLSRRWS
jgi:MinD-like ATPase involved in chromosome partitioning or flagellar assembly